MPPTDLTAHEKLQRGRLIQQAAREAEEARARASEAPTKAQTQREARAMSRQRSSEEHDASEVRGAASGRGARTDDDEEETGGSRHVVSEGEQEPAPMDLNKAAMLIGKDIQVRLPPPQTSEHVGSSSITRRFSLEARALQ